MWHVCDTNDYDILIAFQALVAAEEKAVRDGEQVWGEQLTW